MVDFGFDVGDWVKDGIDDAKSAVSDELKSWFTLTPPNESPPLRPECADWKDSNLVKKVQMKKGKRRVWFYLVPKCPYGSWQGCGDFYKVREHKYLQWFHGEQIKVIDKLLAAERAKIKQKKGRISQIERQLRMDSATEDIDEDTKVDIAEEIEEAAEKVAGLVRKGVPRSYDIFKEAMKRLKNAQKRYPAPSAKKSRAKEVRLRREIGHLRGEIDSIEDDMRPPTREKRLNQEWLNYWREFEKALKEKARAKKK